jgi:O-antigen/teichoic acid export membrane protein
MAFFRKAILVNTATLASLAIQMALTVIVTRVLGPAGIGQYSLVTSALMLSAQICTLGFPVSLLYYCQHDPDGRKVYTVNGIWATAVLGGLGTLVLGLATRTCADYFGALSWLACGIGSLYVLLTPLSGIARNHLMCDLAARKLSLMAVVSMVAPLPLACALAAVHRLDVTTALLCFIVTPLVRLALGAWWMRNEVDWRIRPQAGTMHKLVLMGVRLSSVDVLVLLNSTFSLMILKALDPSFDDLGHFSRGQQLAMAVVTASQAVLPLLFSRWAALPEDQLTRHVELVLRFLATFSAIIIGALMLASKTLVLALYGHAFLPAVVPMMILLPGTLFFLLAKVATQFLGSRGLPELSIGMLVLGAVVNAGLSWLLIPWMGIRGAAVAATLGNLVLLASLLATLKIRFGVRLSRCLWLTVPDCRGIVKQLHWNGSRVREPQSGLAQVQ